MSTRSTSAMGAAMFVNWFDPVDRRKWPCTWSWIDYEMGVAVTIPSVYLYHRAGAFVRHAGLA